jgi:cytochrome c553
MHKMIPVLLVALAGLSSAPAMAGDAAAGAQVFATRGCVGCHGNSGKAPIAPNYPVIGGKPADFIAGELTKFRSKERQEPTMNAMSAGLSDADIANLAAYLASQ